MFSAPDDLRFAIASLQEAQYVKESFQKDVTEFRRTLLIQQKSPVEVTFTFRTGLQCTVTADISYGKVTNDSFRFHFCCICLIPNFLKTIRHLVQWPSLTFPTATSQ